jgi:transposase
VKIRTGEFAGMMSDVFNAITFRRFLTVLMKHGKGKRMQIIIDNARYHHAKLILPWLEKHKDQLFLDYFSPYSPELNPIERLWKLLKKLRLHNRYFPEMKGVVKVVARQFLLRNEENESSKTLCNVE